MASFKVVTQIFRNLHPKQLMLKKGKESKPNKYFDLKAFLK